MRKKTRKHPTNDYEEYLYRRQNLFDFDAWYRAHFHGDFNDKIRNERASKYAQEYQEQMERIARGENILPPRPNPRRNDQPTDIEIQMAKMKIKEYRKDVAHVLIFLLCLIVSFILGAYIIELNTDKSPWVDEYAIRKQKEKEEKKKSST